MELFWLDQLLLLFWGLENWEWLHLSNFVFGAFGPLYYGEIIQYFICHHSEVPSLKATHVPESLFYYWDEGEEALFTSDNLCSKSVFTVPLRPEGVHQFQSGPVRTLVLRHFLSEDLLFPTWTDFSTVK